MPVLPPNDVAFIQFCEYHVPVWQAAPATIGLTAAQVTAFDNFTKASRAAYTAAQNARNASKAATVALKNALSTNRGNAGDLIKVIKAYADSTNNPNVYATAQIPPPAPPTPEPLPTKPTDVAVSLSGDGTLVVSWKSSNSAPSRGASFAVTRRIGTNASTPYTGIGAGVTTARGRGAFADSTVPVGTTTVSYIITPTRGTQTGEASDPVTVQFGVGGALTVTGGTLSIAA